MKDTPKPKPKQTSITNFFTPKSGAKLQEPVVSAKKTTEPKNIVKEPTLSTEKRHEPAEKVSDPPEEPPVKRVRQHPTRLTITSDVWYSV
jgi:hypothetical protein